MFPYSTRYWELHYVVFRLSSIAIHKSPLNLNTRIFYKQENINKQLTLKLSSYLFSSIILSYKSKKRPFQLVSFLLLEELYTRSHFLTVICFVIISPLQKICLKSLWRLLPFTMTRAVGTQVNKWMRTKQMCSQVSPGRGACISDAL